LVEVIADVEKHEYEINLEITIPEFNNNPLKISGRLNKSGFYNY
jgi:hypothetical protein